MNTRTHRGRIVQPKRSPLRMFYTLLALVAVLGVAVLALVFAQRPATPVVPPTNAVSPSDVPTGTTADGFAFKGSPDAPVQVVAYADFQCPACAAASEQIEPTIEYTYIRTGKVQLIFHDFPLQQHQNAVPAALAARCALRQNAFWPMHDRLFSTQDQWALSSDPRSVFSGYATDLGLNTQSFNACVAAPATTTAIQAAFAAGVERGINATPTYLVDGTPVDAQNLQGAIEAALQAKGS
ncbi:MAG: hypothetical protein AVDCRST_MAG93-1254 [uncultured Chloroflexia bacterium]|uniref:Thioredoxin-like fold domain-containing protein n=1 Tax=uncultured Chloroflexia bacterium TaxID=1672391 RepID=A0A6J4I0X3_9CHLR|nr:MAG: hypothetical protein AVDCRST_MAG93-1254 [uncultured Chloroflexia bacterium]